jgi:tetratricopeptide (TPR) repeat protein
MPLGPSRVVLSVLLLTAAVSAQAPQRTRGALELSIAGLLDRYRSGAFEAAVKELSTAGDTKTFRAAYIAAANAWIAVDSTDATKRRLVATAFAIELAHARLAFDNASLMVLVDWARKEWRKGPPSPAERMWTRAAIALIGRGGRMSPTRDGGRDSNWQSRTFLEDAVKRFPDDARLRLAELVWLYPHSVQNLQNPLALRRLTEHPEVGPDALLEFAFLRFHYERDFDAARRLAGQAASRGVEPWTRYLGHFIAALCHEKQGRYKDAAGEYTAALKAVPYAQSASIALAQLPVRDGQADAAFDLINRSLTERPDGDDPWRLFPYGEYVRWPVLIADVRKAIR